MNGDRRTGGNGRHGGQEKQEHAARRQRAVLDRGADADKGAREDEQSQDKGGTEDQWRRKRMRLPRHGVGAQEAAEPSVPTVGGSGKQPQRRCKNIL